MELALLFLMYYEILSLVPKTNQIFFKPKKLDIICCSSFSLSADAEPHGNPAVQPEACQDERSDVPGDGHVCQLTG